MSGHPEIVVQFVFEYARFTPSFVRPGQGQRMSQSGPLRIFNGRKFVSSVQGLTYSVAGLIKCAM